MNAECVGKNREHLWLRIPHRDAHRVLTLPARLYPGIDTGTVLEVSVVGLERGKPSGWTAMVVPK